MFLVLCLLASACLAVPEDEIYGLSDFYHSLDGDSWKSNTNWLVDEDPCNWYGIGCSTIDGEMHVTSISLANNGLSGTIPSDFASHFPVLQSLDVGANNVRGPFPAMPTTVYALSVRQNALTSLPENICDLSLGAYFHFDFNQMSGQIPECIGALTALDVFGVTRNLLTGPVPEDLVNIESLSTLMLGYNMLEGELPAITAENSGLGVLDVLNNDMSGDVPNFSASMLLELDLAYNDFGGDATCGPGPTPNLAVLDLDGNNFHGDAVQLIESSSTRRIFTASETLLSGAAPTQELVDSANIYQTDFTGCPFLCLAADAILPDSVGCFELAPTAAGMDADGYLELTFDLTAGSAFNLSADQDLCVSDVSCAVSADGAEFSSVPGSFSGTVSAAVVTCLSEGDVAAVQVLADGSPVTDVFDTATLEVLQARVRRTAAAAAPVPRGAAADPLKDGPVSVSVFGMSKCPDFSDFIDDILLPALDTVGGIVNLTVGYITEELAQYPTGQWSLHGQTEVVGDTAMACAEELQGMEALLEFSHCIFAEQSSIPLNLEQCAAETGLDVGDMLACSFSPDGYALTAASAALAREMGAVWSPTVYVAGEEVCLWNSAPCSFSDVAGFVDIVCAAYEAQTGAAC
eukprot:gnl/Chilomastix_cuspidata/204.p1 GENE.gnl/Chilomastix_cuspidata/204~~gnl/Chilomastix_cuspidata/204.p1  ORF type:complete len:633 (-),score=259.97 gnl/Chilomastix_cuspidata/204:982-2880(-)